MKSLTSTDHERKAVHQKRLKQSHIEKIKSIMVEHGITIDDLQGEVQTDKEKLAALRKVADNKEKHRRAVKAATVAAAEARRIKRLKNTLVGTSQDGKQETESQEL
jgi:myo-inositol catabolism protein IolC